MRLSKFLNKEDILIQNLKGEEFLTRIEDATMNWPQENPLIKANDMEKYLPFRYPSKILNSLYIII